MTDHKQAYIEWAGEMAPEWNEKQNCFVPFAAHWGYKAYLAGIAEGSKVNTVIDTGDTVKHGSTAPVTHWAELQEQEG